MEWIEFVVLLLLWGNAVRMLYMAYRAIRTGVEVPRMEYRCSENFIVTGKGSWRKQHVQNYWIDIAGPGGEWEHTVFVDAELFKRTKKGEDFGRRDVYTLPGKKKPFITADEGVEPDKSGDEDRMEAAIFIIIAAVLVIGSGGVIHLL